MTHNAQKILFTEFAELRQGDGKGPKFHPGKAYWLSPDQVERWRAEGIADYAPAHMQAENEPALTLRSDDVRLVRSGRRYDLLGPGDIKFNDAPLNAGDAETLRRDILAQGVDHPSVRKFTQPAFVDRADAVPIVLHQHEDAPGIRTYFVDQVWPQRTTVSPDFLSSASPILTIDGDRMLLVLENGHAEYRRLGETAAGDVVYEFVTGDFQPYVPPQPAAEMLAPQADEDAGF